MLRYHAKTLELLRGDVPAGQGDRVEEVEARLGAALPASVREWYADIDGRSVLQKYSNDDHPLSPADFRRVEVEGLTLIILMGENQAVCWWGFELDGSEDPPVYVNVESPPDDLHLYSRTFSDFTYVRVFDHHGFWDEGRMSMDICDPLTADDLALLNDRFEVELTSEGWPSAVTHRFSSPLGRITIWSAPDQSDWVLSSDSPAALGALREQVQPIWRNPIS